MFLLNLGKSNKVERRVPLLRVQEVEGETEDNLERSVEEVVRHHGGLRGWELDCEKLAGGVVFDAAALEHVLEDRLHKGRPELDLGAQHQRVVRAGGRVGGTLVGLPGRVPVVAAN